MAIAYACAAITATMLMTASHLLVRGGRAKPASSEFAGTEDAELSGIDDMFEGDERRNEKNEVVSDQQPDPCAGFVHQVGAKECL